MYKGDGWFVDKRVLFFVPFKGVGLFDLIDRRAVVSERLPHESSTYLFLFGISH